MPILDDIMDHDVIGPAIREGIEKGLHEGRQEGRQEGEAAILRLQLTKRYGALPTWVGDRLTKLSTAELEELSLRVLDARSLDELFSS